MGKKCDMYMNSTEKPLTTAAFPEKVQEMVSWKGAALSLVCMNVCSLSVSSWNVHYKNIQF